jgi:TetR/AcrR family transcriptional repressor of nem operon
MKQECDTKHKLLQAATELISLSSYGSVSVEDICTKAGVNKGSFYYAFKSKSDLAVAAFEDHWQQMQAVLDKIFSVQLSPLQRIESYCDWVVKVQKEKFTTHGKLLGCPFCSLGSELSTQDEKIRLKAEEIGARKVKYLASAISDLAAEGRIEAGDAHELAREIYSHVIGVIMRAKIENNPIALDRLQHGVLRLLNVKELAAA